MPKEITHFQLREAYRLPSGSYTKPHWDEWLDIKTHNAIPDEEVEEATKIRNIGMWYEVAEGEIAIGNTVWWSDPDANTCSGPRTVVGLNPHQVILDHGTEALWEECTPLPLFRRVSAVSRTKPA